MKEVLKFPILTLHNFAMAQLRGNVDNIIDIRHYPCFVEFLR